MNFMIGRCGASWCGPVRNLKRTPGAEERSGSIKMDIRRLTCVIVRKNGEYLVGRVIYTGELRWSTSPYDAWRTRKKEKAAEVARKVGGVMVLFNPGVGETRLM